jgi:hypothetical protein
VVGRAARLLACALASAVAALAGSPGQAGAQVVWAVGDGGVPETTDDELAAFVQGAGPFDRFLYLGDVYETGTREEFQANYQPSFGRFRDSTSPTPGNHEWPNRATGYDPYWGSLAPRSDGGHWYSFDLGGWHIVSLNSEEPLGAGSPQLAWLRRDLAARGGTCTIAFMHRPRYTATSGRADDDGLEPAWSELAGRAVALLSGHDHNYERFQPNRGVVQFVVGTGGRFRYDVDEADPRLAAADDGHHGALRLRLARGSAQFEFLATGGARLDSGSLACTPPDDPPAPTPPPSDGPPSDGPPHAPPAGSTPSLSVLSPRHGSVHTLRLRTMRGAVAAAAGPPSITIVRRAPGACARFDGRSFVRSSCRTRKGVTVGASAARWRLSLPASAQLGRGRYRLTARVTGTDGRRRLAGVTFRIR